MLIAMAGPVIAVDCGRNSRSPVLVVVVVASSSRSRSRSRSSSSSSSRSSSSSSSSTVTGQKRSDIRPRTYASILPILLFQGGGGQT